ncbi:polysaccharide biosynthesis protein [Bacillus cereus]|uniref:PssD/Cps14F family polysaccharide biosynthesis glycosyltransferase n=1 Tax=Bacillus cereus TaxID=1396 RepID=UPI0018F42473|nr:PssD/Cps14F family polysaccharide biosynthesis glycosyltransferase [Bacillus cereus]MBJ8051878.1 polysaccharide biosynthesis protein [Bacillus cereus]
MQRVCFISSTGGHLTQLKNIIKSFDASKIKVITEKNETTVSLQKNYDISYLAQQERKNIFFPLIFFINIILSFWYVIKIRPQYIISTGAGAVIPFCIFGKIFGGKLIFIESFAKVQTPTITGRILYHFADKFYVQWEELLEVYEDAEFKGRLY